MSVLVVQGDARELPLPDASVDLIVTSPPYFGLRSYTDGGAHYAGQIGSEGTPAAWLVSMLDCTREMVRVLKPPGSLFVNLGDKYAGGRSGSSGWAQPNKQTGERFGVSPDQDKILYDIPVDYDGAAPKSLLGLPWRYALAAVDQLGLILRAEIIWAKPNGLPESVTDRVRRAHEQVFHFTLRPRYYSAVDEIREPHQDKAGPPSRFGAITVTGSSRSDGVSRDQTFKPPVREYNPLGKLPGSVWYEGEPGPVWSIPSQPFILPREFAHARCCQATDPDCKLGLDHFAAFPMELPRRLILGWSPPGVCSGCGEGRRPVSTAEQQLLHIQRRSRGFADLARPNGDGAGVLGPGLNMPVTRRLTTITGYTCACPTATAPTLPSVVLDPFGGTGTTALLAHTLGRTGITIDRSADYARIAAWRTQDPGERARAMQVDKPPVIPPNQDALFEVTP